MEGQFILRNSVIDSNKINEWGARGGGVRGEWVWVGVIYNFHPRKMRVRKHKLRSEYGKWIIK